jgi:DNA-directed RNA polymerase subunit RPC12/RpoP
MLSRLECWIWGHAVQNEVYQRGERACTRCGRPMLRDDGAVVRVGHTLGCFFVNHTYERVGQRHGHTEYACVRCGHPLLFPIDADPYAARGIFDKKVRYLCGLFGHRVHRVTERSCGTEYACGCGHTFVQHPEAESLVRHPMRCVLLGHWISFVERRGAFSEYACRACGHPFLFRVGRGLSPAVSSRRSTDTAA